MIRSATTTTTMIATTPNVGVCVCGVCAVCLCVVCGGVLVCGCVAMFNNTFSMFQCRPVLCTLCDCFIVGCMRLFSWDWLWLCHPLFAI